MFTETRKADRMTMLDVVVALIVECGARVIEREGEHAGLPRKRRCLVTLEAENGLRLTVDFDGASSQPNIHVLSWYIATDHKWDAVKPAPGFAPSVNPCHWHKATDICEGFESLCATLRKRLASARDGTAFQCA